MANASAKRTATQNEVAVKNLKLGMLIASVLSVLFRLLFRRSSLSSFSSIFIYAITFIPTFLLSRYLMFIGKPKRDVAGTLLSAGDDLNQPGLTEYAFDIIYVTWVCQVGSGIFGDKFWWFYGVIPVFAIYKLWGLVISPLLLGRKSASPPDRAEGVEMQNLSKRQEKLRKRQEKGDPRVQTKTTRR